MKQFKSIPILFSLALLVGFAAGCATGNVNPPKARASTGYVDFRADSSGALSWQVAQYDDRTQNFKVIFSELSPPPDGILRLAFAPGQYQLQVTFLNRVVSEPGFVEVEVVDGKVTPVHVTLISVGTTSVQRKEQRVGTTVKGYSGRTTKVTNNESVMFRVAAVAAAPLPYQPK